MIREIYLDLDDVLNFCAPFIINEVAGTRNEMSYEWWQRRWGYEIIEGITEIRESLGKNPISGDFWATISRDVWATIPKTPECDWLFDAACRAVGVENVYILTRPTRYGDCHGGKIDWVIESLGEMYVERTILTKFKSKLAKEDRLLIDDNPLNVDGWLAAGGRSIMVPRPWNPLHAFPVAEYISVSWENYFAVPMPEFSYTEEAETE